MSGDAEALHQSGLEHLRRGERREARRSFEAALALEPARTKTLNNLARLELEDGRFDAALSLVERSLALDPGARALGLRGQALTNLGRFDDAKQALRDALEADPNQAASWAALARGTEETDGRAPAAEVWARAAAALPGDATIANNYGVVLTRLSRDAEAVVQFERATRLDATQVDTWANYADALRRTRRWDDAARAVECGLALDPDSASNALVKANLAAGSLALPQALSILDRALQHATGATRRKLGALRLFVLCHDDRPTAAELLTAHRTWTREWMPRVDSTTKLHARDTQPLHVAYLSSDFREHVVMKFLRPVLERHDPLRVKATLLSATTDRDAHTLAFARDARFVDVVGLTPRQLAEKTRALGIDVLVELNGLTDHEVVGLLEERLAPVQLTYLGYPSTTGLDGYDGRITDPWVDPPGVDAQYSEPLVRLPRTMWTFPSDGLPEVRDRPADAPIAFGSFNRPEKLSPTILGVWREILGRVPGARLRLRSRMLSEGVVRRRLLDMLGVELEARVDILPFAPGEHGAYTGYAELDVALDTFPYHGTTTTCDALVMGVPVVSWQGDVPASRVGRSLLTSVGLEDLSVDSRSAYVEAAVALADDAPRRRLLRRTLRERVRSGPLGDAAGLARALETLYESMARATR